MSEKASFHIPDDLATALATTRRIVHEYLSTIRFIVGNSARDPAFTSTHLLSYLSQDFIESAGSIAFLAQSGSLVILLFQLSRKATMGFTFVARRAGR